MKGRMRRTAATPIAGHSVSEVQAEVEEQNRHICAAVHASTAKRWMLLVESLTSVAAGILVARAARFICRDGFASTAYV